MRVHHFINYYGEKGGGAGKVVEMLHSGLMNRGVDSSILALAGSGAAVEQEIQSLGFASPYRLPVLPGLIRYVRKNVGPGDILHAHLFPANLYLSMLHRLLRKPVSAVCTEHNTHNRRRGTAAGWLIDRFTYAGCDRIAAISAGTKSELEKWKPELRDRIVVISNGAVLAFDAFIHRDETDRPVILSAGRLHDQKNYGTALEAISLIRDLDFEYVIAGDGPKKHELVQLTRDLGIESRVKFKGFVKNMPELFRRADIFLMPSLWEGFGLAAVEAMNAGLPLVVSDVAGLREVVDGEPACALIVDPADSGQIAAALAELLASSEKRARLGRAGFERSLHFSSGRMVDAYISLYNGLQPAGLATQTT